MWVVAAGPKLRASTAPMPMLLPPPPALAQTQLLPSPPLPALLWSSPIRSARSPSSPCRPRDVVAAAARRRRRGAGGGGRRRGRRRWEREVAGLRRGGVLGRAVRGGGRRAVRLVPALRRAPPLRPPLRAAGVPDPHGRLRLRAYATCSAPFFLYSVSTHHVILSAPVIADERSYRCCCAVASLSSNSSVFPKVESSSQFSPPPFAHNSIS